MKYAFGSFELDVRRQTLSRGEIVLHVPHRVFATLYLLVANHDRDVTKDELLQKVWRGNVVGDDSLTAAVREARRLVGDDGRSQRMIRTLHGVGYRWVGEARLLEGGSRAALPGLVLEDEAQEGMAQIRRTGRPSIAVLPFAVLTSVEECGLLGDAVAAELIGGLARLAWLKVIARGSSFRFHEPAPDPAAVARLLDVRYVLSGTIERNGSRLEISVELARTLDAVVIWSERFAGRIDDVHDIRAHILAAAIAALELRIPAEEARAALTMAVENLDAWAEFHIGLRHLYRYNLRDMDLAEARFEAALAREPGFARAHAGLSFIAFQRAFMHVTGNRERAIDEAAAHAARSLELDPLDPFGNYCMGRASWISGDLESASVWARRSFAAAPGYAHGHYLYAMMDLYSGGTEMARRESATSLSMSPIDPLSYGMLATHASALIGEGAFEAAVAWSEEAALRPEAHYLIDMIAAAANELAGRPGRAEFWARRIRRRRPDATGADFFESFQYRECLTQQNLSGAFCRLGFSGGRTAESAAARNSETVSA
ncbi:MAG: winged helix-turn-helix domain-containing protein [Rhodobacteraceae bacterium]|nr:winged helix-turn-helix domain-containing protein [Paracoccaceae bacterium]